LGDWRERLVELGGRCGDAGNGILARLQETASDTVIGLNHSNMHRKFTSIVLALTSIAASNSALAEPVTAARLNELPSAEQPAWKTHWDRSQASARADLAALRAELTAQNLAIALRAPSGGDFKLPASADDAWYSSDAANQLASVVLSYQTPSGGWSKHTGYTRGPRQPGMQFSSQSEPGQKPHYLATFDNRATTEEMCFLATVWNATKREDCKAGFITGLDYILAARYPNGGWPQVYPLEGKYHDNITFNDDAMTRILELLQDIKNNDPCYSFVDDARRQRVSAALSAGLDCLLRVQVVQDGKKTGWCAQYDPLTLQPAAARAMEPVTLSGMESSRILRFLMSITTPAPEVVASIESGLAWMDQVKITGLAKTNVAGKSTYVSNPASTEIYWARFYNLTNSQPVFPGRDGVIYNSFADMAANNHLGYDYLSTLPGSVVSNGQKKWRKLLAQSVTNPPAASPSTYILQQQP
jgi:PelA/Pel-15E family pectate lyase